MQGRSAALKAISEEEFDVAVIGGGLVGAGIAQNAACRGLSVVLIEKGDFASGASSKTTKLLYWRGRHLEQLTFKLKGDQSDDNSLEQSAPHLFKDVSFILPTSNKKRLLAWKAQAGLALTDLFSSKQSKRGKGPVRLARKEVLGSVPGLSSNVVTGGLRFHDCVTDDSRLVLEIIKSASQHGAICINYLAAQSFEKDGNRINAIICRDRYGGQDVRVVCRTVVNAAGVWSDALMEKLDPAWQKQVVKSKAVHIMLPNSAIETNSALLLPTADGKFVFVVPWQKALLVGATDACFEGSPDNPLAEEEEIQYLLDAINIYAREDRRVSRADVIASWAGLRPMIGKNAFADRANAKTTGDYEIYDGAGTVIGVIGGELPNYKAAADEVMSRLMMRLPLDKANAAKQVDLKSNMLGGWSDKDDYLTSTAEISAKARRLSIEPGTIDHLCLTYGKDALRILEIVEADPWLGKRICPDYPPIMAEIVFSIKHEMAVCLEDTLFRRVRLGLVDQGQCLLSIEKVARLVQGVLGWDDVRANAEIKVITSILEEHLNLKPVGKGE